MKRFFIPLVAISAWYSLTYMTGCSMGKRDARNNNPSIFLHGTFPYMSFSTSELTIHTFELFEEHPEKIVIAFVLIGGGYYSFENAYLKAYATRISK